MKLPCENCIKADVCKNKENSNEWLTDLALSKSYQSLENNNIKLYATCKSFYERSKK